MHSRPATTLISPRTETSCAKDMLHTTTAPTEKAKNRRDGWPLITWNTVVPVSRIFVLTLLTCNLAAAFAQQPIDGWQGARFGMGLNEVHRLFPQARLRQNTYCAPSLRQYRDSDVKYRCDELEMEVDVAPLRATATLRFLETTGGFASATLRLDPPSPETYAAVRSVYMQRHGAPKVQDNERPETGCADALSRHTAGERLPRIRFSYNTMWRKDVFDSPSGSLTMVLWQNAVCNNIPPEVQLSPDFLPGKLESPALYVTYEAKVRLTGKGL